jgi:hypothetical protein
LKGELIVGSEIEKTERRDYHKRFLQNRKTTKRPGIILKNKISKLTNSLLSKKTFFGSRKLLKKQIIPVK